MSEHQSVCACDAQQIIKAIIHQKKEGKKEKTRN